MAARKIRKLEPNIEKNKLEEKKVWSDLPTEISLLIFSLLTFKERICASVVCKSWFSVLISGRLLNKSPLLMKIWNFCPIYQLYNPSTGKTKYKRIPQLDDCWTYSCSIDGWLLVCQQLTLRVFFFNPFTKVSIDLPRFNLSRGANHRVTFSSSPMSHDCTVYDLKNISPTTVALSTCNLRSIEWTTNHYQIPQPTSNIKWAKIIISGGLLYCLGGSCFLRIFDTRISEWIQNVVHPPRIRRLPNKNKGKGLMVGHEGHIFLCCGNDPVFIFKLDATKEKWEKMSTFGGVNFFVSHWSAIVRAYVLGMQENDIYVSEYSKEKKHRCKHCSVDEGGYFRKNRKKKFILQKKKTSQGIWIDPPEMMHTS